MRKYTKIICMLLVSLMLVSTISMFEFEAEASYGVPKEFSDVSADAWYYEYVSLCSTYNIILGYDDGTFRPDDNLKVGEFLKLITMIAELWITDSDTSVHWAQPYYKVLNDAGVLEGANFSLTYDDMEADITRYEMANIIRNLVFNVYGENAVVLEDAETYIGDYSLIPMAYLSAVEQTYGKGILSGVNDEGSFGGDGYLTRAQAAKVIVNTAWPSQRSEIEFAEEYVPDFDPVDSFAWQYRTMTTEERRYALFGDSTKTYFTGYEWNLSTYIVSLEITYWDLKSDGVTWYEKTQTIEVNKVLVDEVTGIFEDLYNLPISERFPIYYVGGARYTDTLRHSWGAALDINANHNYYLEYSTGTMVGEYCYLNSDSPYCIEPDSAIVQIFAKYGWGWGGEGWTSAVDYMHFSILASGG